MHSFSDDFYFGRDDYDKYQTRFIVWSMNIEVVFIRVTLSFIIRNETFHDYGLIHTSHHNQSS